MSETAADQPPRAHARIVYLGPVSPHWEVYGDWGDRTVLDEFRARVLARLVLLPRDDPQFRRNRERVARDAEREHLILEWDLGYDEGAVLLAVQMALVGRHYERIADHAVTIAERVGFMVTGEHPAADGTFDDYASSS